MENSTANQKKITKKGVILIGLIILAVIGYGYYDLVLKHKINGTTLIDNPTAQAIEVVIDGKKHNVPANSFQKVELTLGLHKIDCKAHNILGKDLNIDPVEYGVINPTKSKYVIYNIIYTQKDLSDQFKPYEVEGKLVYSLLDRPIVTTDLFIPDRTLGKGNIDDKEPALESYNKMNQDYSFLMKIFRLKDFFEFYDKNNK